MRDQRIAADLLTAAGQLGSVSVDLSLLLSKVSELDRAALPPRGVVWRDDLGAWLVTSYQGVRTVLRHGESLFRLAHREAASEDVIVEIRGGNRSHRLLRGAEHATLHRWYMKWFLRSEVDRYEEQHIRPLADQVIRQFERQSHAELFRDYCAPLGPRIVAGILALDVSADDDEFFLRAQSYNDSILAWNAAPSDAQVIADAIRASHSFDEMLIDTVRARKARPTDDLISRMWREGPEIDPDWSERDVTVATREMYLGASATTRDGLANALHILLVQPRLQQEVVRNGGEVLSAFIEESLRLQDSRVLVGLPRIANEDVEVEGATIRRNDVVVLMTDSANTDPAHYSDPDVIQIDRVAPKDHFVFGAGPRACVGANLGRAQIRVGVEVLFSSLPAIRLDGKMPRPARTGLGAGYGRGAYAPLHVTF